MKKIHFILSTWGDAHQLSRTIHVEKILDKVERHAYLRDYYPSGYEHLSKGIIGQLGNGIYNNRILTYLKAINYFRKLEKSKITLFYIFGLDNLFCFYIGCIISLSKFNVIYEIDDVRDIVSQNNIVSKLLFTIECFLIKKSKLIITTSEAFLEDFYFKKGCFRLPFKLMENKVHLDNSYAKDLLETEKKECDNSKIKLGFFGLIRCPRSIEILLQLVRKFNNIDVIMRGYIMPNCKHLEVEIENTNGINYYGTYVSPNDLNNIYSEIDISWICYPFGFEGQNNWKWARTNRFYEAGFFKKPMIAAAGTKDADKVIEYGVGLVLNLGDIYKSVNDLGTLSCEMIIEMVKNYDNIDENNFKVTDDYYDLAHMINEIK